MNEYIVKAISVLNQGGIIIFPTDTAFGIGCRIDKEEAIKKLFSLRKRPETQATPVLVSGIEMAKEYWLDVPEKVYSDLIIPFWPGGLTIVLPCDTEKVAELVRGNGETLGMRMPNHPVALAIIKELGVPILGPSANFHGEKTPFLFEDLDPELVKLVDYVVPGECSSREASTVIDCSVEPWKILRQGAISLNQELREEIILYIDTSNNKQIQVCLKINEEKYAIEQVIDQRKAQAVLPMIENLLREQKITLQELTGIKVNPGPGSFTGLRVGITIANTLGYLLKIPVNNKPLGEMVEAVYS